MNVIVFCVHKQPVYFLVFVVETIKIQLRKSLFDSLRIHLYF